MAPRRPDTKSRPRARGSKRSEIAAVISEETSDKRIDPRAERRYWLDDDLRDDGERARVRHDRGYVPRGFRKVGDRLHRNDHAEPPMSRDDRVLAEAAIELLRSCLHGADDFTLKLRAACNAIFEDVHGHPLGAAWRRALADLLRERVQAREQARIGGDTEWPPTRTSREILDLVRQRCAPEPVPSWLTEEAIEKAIGHVNLGGSGGRHKLGWSAERCVALLDENARKRRR